MGVLSATAQPDFQNGGKVVANTFLIMLRDVYVLEHVFLETNSRKRRWTMVFPGQMVVFLHFLRGVFSKMPGTVLHPGL